MQREHRKLEADADDDKGKAHAERTAVAILHELMREVGHIERAGRHQQKAKADDEEGRPDRTHDEVVV